MKLSKLVFSFFLITGVFFMLSAQNYQMVEVTGGTLDLGATAEQETDAYPKERPAHSVQLSDFYMGVYEVSQADWITVMGDNPSLNLNNEFNSPVDYIDWMSAIVFCNEMTMKDPSFGLSQCVYYTDAAFTQVFDKSNYQNDGNSAAADVYIDYSKKGYRLPSEAEWEYAARGGQSTLNSKYAGGNNMEDLGVFTDNSEWKTFPVGSKLANELGLFDMSGNVWEMVNDWYGPYINGPSVDPKGPALGSHRVLRGGAYDYGDRMCRVSSRYMFLPDDKDSDIGFRVARSK